MNFGYKNKTSCTQALFIFKEMIIKHVENNLHIFGALLDAIKSFDNLWRQALYLKNEKKVILLSAIILLHIYYEKLAAKIKINDILSTIFKLKSGVKQGGFLYDTLFNFFINDLIEECHKAGVGAVYIDLIVAILVFCDDICPLSINESEMQSLLNICDNFSKKWAIDFNPSKSKFIVFGSNKLSKT
jgi:hypothetical protein